MHNILEINNVALHHRLAAKNINTPNLFDGTREENNGTSDQKQQQRRVLVN